MNKNKPYYGYICWYPKYQVYSKEYDGVFEVWAENEEKAKELLKAHYGVGISFIDIKVEYRFVYHLWCKLFNKIPKRPKCNHI